MYAIFKTPAMRKMHFHLHRNLFSVKKQQIYELFSACLTGIKMCVYVLFCFLFLAYVYSWAGVCMCEKRIKGRVSNGLACVLMAFRTQCNQIKEQKLAHNVYSYLLCCFKCFSRLLQQEMTAYAVYRVRSLYARVS